MSPPCLGLRLPPAFDKTLPAPNELALPFGCRSFDHSRVYRVRFRLSNGPRIYDAPSHSAIREVAEAKARGLIEEQEKELAGILGPKALRDAALRPLASHCADFVADLAMRERSKAHRMHVKCRLERLIKECHWQQFRDVTVESFTNWQSRQKDLSAKTLNEYLGHASALLN